MSNTGKIYKETMMGLDLLVDYLRSTNNEAVSILFVSEKLFFGNYDKTRALINKAVHRNLLCLAQDNTGKEMDASFRQHANRRYFALTPEGLNYVTKEARDLIEKRKGMSKRFKNSFSVDLSMGGKKIKELAPGVVQVLGVGTYSTIKDEPQTLNIHSIPNSVFSLGKMK